MPDTSMNPPVLDALIIGAGFSGMYQLHCLRDRQGLSALVLEAGAGVGGTWYWNRYPGARCDSESHSYCYSFSQEMLQEWEWSERYPEQPEIMRYMNYVADKFDLKRDIRFNTRVIAAHWDAPANLWRVETEAGQSYAARYLITAVGCLSTANVPKFPGLESYEGRWVHTGEWPHEGVDFTGLRVGQIGTGSTGIQSIPVIAAQAASLTVFQRTANYSTPARNHPLSPEFQAWVKANYGEIVQTMRETRNGHWFRIKDRSIFDVTDEEREAAFEESWEKGGLQFRSEFGDITTNLEANSKAAEFIKRKIRETVKDPEKARLLSDIDHPYAAKRPPIDTGYFEAMNLDHVSLVDVKANPIVEITPKGVRTTAGEYELDMIVFATGFDAMTGPLLRLNITGRDGVALRDVWAAGPRSYLGLQVEGFPNMFTITGPGSPSVLTNMPVAIEQHVEFITTLIAHMRAEGVARIEPEAEAVADWLMKVNEASHETLLPQAASSWYLGANVPGKPRVFMPYAGGMAKYRGICEEVAAEGYKGFVLERETALT